ncbi:MAG: cytochrome c oxidase assembly protein [Chloroflexi bacterium]|nr:cytochrome c oxidase assembly protein [Chloroflexota bacterium]
MHQVLKTLDPSIFLPIVAAALAYAALYHRSQADSRVLWPLPAVFSFALGILVLVLALLWPLDTLADQYFWAHMLQHMLLLMGAPPLLLLGLPVPALLRSLPRTWRRNAIRPLARNRLFHRVMQLLLHPITIFAVFNLVVGFWHVPWIFAAASDVLPLHIAEHASYLGAGLLLWWAIVEPLRVWPRGAELAKIVFLVLCHLPMLVLGQFFLAFSSRPLYPDDSTALAQLGISPLTDQRIGGGIMFGFDMLVTLTAVSVLFGHLLREIERRQLAVEAQQDQHPESLLSATARPAHDAARQSDFHV